MMNYSLENLNDIIEDVLIEFCETYPIPDFTDKSHLSHLRSVLEQMGYDILSSNEIFEAISLAPKKFTLEAPIKKKTAVKPEDKVKADAHKKGLEGKGGTAYGPIGRDIITYRNQNGKLVPVNPPQKIGKGKQQVPTKKTVPTKAAQPQAKGNVKAQPKVQPKVGKGEPVISDPKLSNATMKVANKGLAQVIKAGGIPKNDGVGIITVLTKTLNGQNLNAKEKEIASKYFSVKANPADAAIYINYPPGKGTKHIKIKVGNKNLDKLVNYGKQNFPTPKETPKGNIKATSPIPGKGMTAMSINPQNNDVQIKHDKNSFQFGNGTKVEKVKLPPKGALIKSFMKNQKMSKDEAERQANKLIIAAEQNNAVVDYFGKASNIKMINWGAEPTSDEGRKTILNNVREKSIKKFEYFFKKSGGGQLTPEQKKILNFYKNLKSPYENPNWNRLAPQQKYAAKAEYTKGIEKVMEMMVKDSSFRASVPDYVEVLRYSAYLGQGYEAYLPADSTFQISDIIVVAPRDVLKFNAKGKDLAEQITGRVSSIIESLIFTGGVSEKFLEGGASSGIERVLQSEFFGGKNGTFKTKERTLEMMKMYDYSFRQKDRFEKQNPRLEGFDKDYKAARKAGKTEEEATAYAKKEATKRWQKLSKDEQKAKLAKFEEMVTHQSVASEKELKQKQSEIDKYINDAVKAGIITSQQAEEIRKEGEKQEAAIAKKVDNKGAGKCLSKEEKVRYKKQLGLWCRMGAAVEMIYNNDLKFTYFKNSRELFDGKGNFKQNQLLNGVDPKCGMNWSFDPGTFVSANVQGGPKGCASITMNNPNSSHIIPIGNK